MKADIRKAGPMETGHGAICLECQKYPEGIERARRCRAEWLRQRMVQGLDLLVAYVKDASVGFIEGEPMDLAGWQVADLYWLRCVYVKPEFRGQGIGELLLHTLEQDAARRSRGLYAADRVASLDLARWLSKQNYHPYQAEERTLYGKLFRGLPEPLRRAPQPPVRNRPQPDARTVLIEHYWSAACARQAYDSHVLQHLCARLGSRVRLHSVCQDEPKLVSKYGGAPGYVFIDGAEPAGLYKGGPEDPDAVQQTLWRALRAKRLL